jgi:electron transfer flavoprotein alpha subunit
MHITQVIPEKCTGCEDCVFVCTRLAIRMVEKKAVILDNCNDCKDCWHRCADRAIFHGDDHEAASEEAGTAASQADWRGVLAWVDAEGGKLTAGSRELLSAARQLADGLGVYVDVYMQGSREAADDAVARGGDRIHLGPPPTAGENLVELHEKALLELVSRNHFELVLFPAGQAGLELAPRLAQKLEAVLFPVVSGLEVDSESRDLTARIPIYGGTYISEQAASGARPQMVLVGPGAFPEASADRSREGQILE